MPPDRAELEASVRRLAAIERGSTSAGEREAAEWIAERLRGLGADARVEEEPAHGTYWWPAVALNGLGVLGAMAAKRGRRLLGVALGAVGAARGFDDGSGG